MGSVAELTRNLFPVILAHCVINFVLILVLTGVEACNRLSLDNAEGTDSLRLKFLIPVLSLILLFSIVAVVCGFPGRFKIS